MPGIPISTLQGSPYYSSLNIAYMRRNRFIVDLVATVMPVKSESGNFYVIPFDFSRRRHSTRRAPDGPAPRSAPGLLTGTFSCREYVHAAVLTERRRKAAMDSPDGFKSLDKLYSGQALHPVMMDWEYDLVAKLHNTSNYFSSSHYTTLSGTSRWDQLSTSTPRKDVRTYGEVVRARSGIPLSELTLIVPEEVAVILPEHPDVVARIQYVQRVERIDIGPVQLAQYFGVKQVLIGGALELTSNPGASSEVVSHLWGKNVVLLHIDDTPPSPELGISSSVVTASASGKNIPVARTYPEYDPEGLAYEQKMIAGITLGVPTGEGLRTAALLKSVIS